MTQEDTVCSTPSCLTARQVTEAVLKTKMNWVIALSGAAVTLLTYSVLWQAPMLKESQTKEINQIRVELANEVSQRTAADREARVDIDRIKERLSAVEEERGGP
jgi:hypothetical protein